MVRKEIAAIDDGVAQSLVRVVHAHLRTETPFDALLGSLGHLLEVLEIVLHAVFTVLRRDAFHSLMAHLLLRGVIGVRLARLDHFQCILVQLVEVVRRVGDFVAVDIEEGKVLQNRILELGLYNVDRVRAAKCQQWTDRRTLSFVGLVSSKRMIILPLYILAKYWLSIAALAWPMWR